MVQLSTRNPQGNNSSNSYGHVFGPCTRPQRLRYGLGYIFWYNYPQETQGNNSVNSVGPDTMLRSLGIATKSKPALTPQALLGATKALAKQPCAPAGQNPICGSEDNELWDRSAGVLNVPDHFFLSHLHGHIKPCNCRRKAARNT